MKFLPLLFLLTSCATRIDNGSFHFITYSNATHMRMTGPGVSLEVDGLRNSTPTREAGYAIAHVLTAAGSAALPFAGGPAVLKAAPIIPATLLPAFRTGEASNQ